MCEGFLRVAQGKKQTQRDAGRKGAGKVDDSQTTLRSAARLRDLEQIWDIVSLFRDIIGAGQGSQPYRAMDVDLSHVGPSVGGGTSVFILVVTSSTTTIEFAPSCFSLPLLNVVV